MQGETARVIFAIVISQRKSQTKLVIEAARQLHVANQQIIKVIKLTFRRECFEGDFRANARHVAK